MLVDANMHRDEYRIIPQRIDDGDTRLEVGNLTGEIIANREQFVFRSQRGHCILYHISFWQHENDSVTKLTREGDICRWYCQCDQFAVSFAKHIELVVQLIWMIDKFRKCGNRLLFLKWAQGRQPLLRCLFVSTDVPRMRRI